VLLCVLEQPTKPTSSGVGELIFPGGELHPSGMPGTETAKDVVCKGDPRVFKESGRSGQEVEGH
jgi:hypothetical protein